MNAIRTGCTSLRFRLTLYLAGLAAIATIWGYLLFIRPQGNEARAANATYAAMETNESGAS